MCAMVVIDVIRPVCEDALRQGKEGAILETWDSPVMSMALETTLMKSQDCFWYARQV